MLRKHSISTDLAPEGVSSRSQVRDSRISRRPNSFPRGVLRGGGGHYCLKQTEVFEWISENSGEELLSVLFMSYMNKQFI